MDTKLAYQKESVDWDLYTMKGFYIWFMPVRVPYGKLHDTAKNAGFDVKGAPVVEKQVMVGNGWIGVPVKEHKDGVELVKIEGEFTTYLHVGSYKKLGDTFTKIMKEYPKAKEWYTMYLNSPADVSEDKLETKILFR